MTSDEWVPLYRLLCGGQGGRKADAAQMRACFDALRHYSADVVKNVVQRANQKTWEPFRPTSGDLAEMAAGIMRTHTQSCATNATPSCELCCNSWRDVECDGVSATSDDAKPLPLNRAAHCGVETVHGPHGYVVRCECFSQTA